MKVREQFLPLVTVFYKSILECNFQNLNLFTFINLYSDKINVNNYFSLNYYFYSFTKNKKRKNKKLKKIYE